MIDRKKVCDAFREYTDTYNTKDVKIALKVKHTYEVAKVCDSIAKAEGFSDKDTDLAWLCGMLHDIGRFEQLKRYNTFVDAQSIDHAQFGSSLLFEDGLIQRFCDDTSCYDILQKAIYWHSAYRLPENMDARTMGFAKLLRDADKIDIFRVCTETPFEDIYNVTKEQLLQAEITDEVMESFYEEHATLRSIRKTPVDNIVGHISLVYELEYPVSHCIVEKQGYLEKLLTFQSKNPKTQAQFEKIQKHIKGYMQTVAESRNNR